MLAVPVSFTNSSGHTVLHLWVVAGSGISSRPKGVEKWREGWVVGCAMKFSARKAEQSTKCRTPKKGLGCRTAAAHGREQQQRKAGSSKGAYIVSEHI